MTLNIVIQQSSGGGTPWWIPLLSALAGAAFALLGGALREYAKDRQAVKTAGTLFHEELRRAHQAAAIALLDKNPVPSELLSAMAVDKYLEPLLRSKKGRKASEAVVRAYRAIFLVVHQASLGTSNAAWSATSAEEFKRIKRLTWLAMDALSDLHSASTPPFDPKSDEYKATLQAREAAAPGRFRFWRR